MGAPISTYYQVLQLMTDKDNPAHVEIAKNALKPFNLFVVALYHPERHWELGRVMERDFSLLDETTGEKMLFFAPIQPSAGWMEMVHGKRGYSQLIDLLWKQGVELSLDSPHEGDIDAAFQSLASELSLPETMLPCLIVTPDITKEKVFPYKTCPEHAGTQLNYLGQVARDHPEIKYDWGAGKRVLAQMRDRIDLCGGSTARDLPRPLVEVLKEHMSSYYFSLLERMNEMNSKIDALRLPEEGYDKKDKGADERKYAFYERSGTWTIIFDGKEIPGLRTIGMKGLHYLVCRQGVDVSVQEINAHYATAASGNPSQEKFYELRLNKGSFSPQDVTDAQTIIRVKERLDELNYEYEAAMRSGEQEAIAKILDDRQKCENYLKEATKPVGETKIKRFQDDADHLAAIIGKRIDRAIEEIEDRDPKVGRHFRKAIRPIYSAYLSYKPDPASGMRWQTE